MGSGPREVPCGGSPSPLGCLRWAVWEGAEAVRPCFLNTSRGAEWHPSPEPQDVGRRPRPGSCCPAVLESLHNCPSHWGQCALYADA